MRQARNQLSVQDVTSERIPEAAALFGLEFARLRSIVPEVPDGLADAGRVQALLSSLLDAGGCLAAIDGGRLVGFLGWFQVDDARNTGQRGAYCPEWGHAVAVGAGALTYRILYREAARRWAAAGSRVHAISVLSHDRPALDTWFWNGFGLAVVDAIRPMQPVGARAPDGCEVRRAGPQDAPALAHLDWEHIRHYTGSPIFMFPRPAHDAAQFASSLDEEGTRVYLAFQGEEPVGFMQFSGSSEGAAEAVSAEDQAAITAAYVRPAARGQGLAAALLDAGLAEYAGLDYRRCSVDFESFNPEAATFWTKHFRPVSYSLMRVPERSGLVASG